MANSMRKLSERLSVLLLAFFAVLFVAAGSGDESPPAETLLLDGYCPVSLVKRSSWIPGDLKFKATHNGTVYLCAGQKELTQFLADPDKYSPVHSGCDVVTLKRSGKKVAGSRKHAVLYKDRIYLFASEKNIKTFELNLQKYALPVRQHQAP